MSKNEKNGMPVSGVRPFPVQSDEEKRAMPNGP
jgi:hypothetical protein